MLGVFDSGVGGLTVVNALCRINSDIDLIYLGDTARVPYGNRSKKTIIRYAADDINFLIKHGATKILAACNTVSAIALNDLKSEFKIPISGVIEPAVYEALRISSGNIGIIGTKATINSHIYKNLLNKKSINVYEEAAPLLVPFVEEGWINKKITKELINIYMRPLLLKKIDSLILGCTHYPLLYDNIRSAVGNNINIISSADAAAKLMSNSLDLSGSGIRHFFVTDSAESFKNYGKIFLGAETINVKEVVL